MRNNSSRIGRQVLGRGRLPVRTFCRGMSSLFEALEERRLLSNDPIVVTSALDEGVGTLRQAILDANAAAGADVITFNIDGDTLIQLAADLPEITEAVTIDGTTQPGIVVDGGGIPDGVSGFRVSAPDTTIKGLAITGFGLDGIEVVDADNCTISGNFIYGNQVNGVSIAGDYLTAQVSGNWIGLDSSGSGWNGNISNGLLIDGPGAVAVSGNVISGNYGNAVRIIGTGKSVILGNIIGLDVSGTSVEGLDYSYMGNGANGITLVGDATAVQIGDGTAAGRNVIAACGADGIRIAPESASGAMVDVQILGNYLGTNAAGEIAVGVWGNTLGNYGNGISLLASGALVQGNLIAGNYGYGVQIGSTSGPASFNAIYGNLIGTNEDGTADYGNGYDGEYGGVRITGSGNIVGGTGVGQANVIAFNNGVGVEVAEGTGNAIRGNSIYDNKPSYSSMGLGIDLGVDGVSTGAPHAGANNYQSFPVISSAVINGSALNISGVITGSPNAHLVIDFYANLAADPSGYGEGRMYLGSLTADADSTGYATIQGVIPAPASPMLLTATATDASYNTSEFSAGVEMTIGQTYVATETSLTSSANPSYFGQEVTFTATVLSLAGSEIPTGSVEFIDGSTVLGQAALVSGQASISISDLAAGSHSITAVYTATGLFLDSVSVPLSQLVELASTTTALISSLNPSTFGQSVTLTAVVEGPVTLGAPTGQVQFMDGSSLLGVGSLDLGQATFETSSLAIGLHTITAVYVPSGIFVGSVSDPLEQSVQVVPTATALVSSANPSTFGQAVTLTATVVGGTGMTGTVQFVDVFKGNATVLASVAIDAAGVAEFTTSGLSAGVHYITASYSGDATFDGSMSVVLDQVVGKVTPIITWANPAGIVYGTALSGAQLNATADVAGSFMYTPGAGTVLHAGDGQVLHVDFTPTDSENYTTASMDVAIDVAKAAVTMQITGGTFVYDGLAHPASGVSVSGVLGESFSAEVTYSPGGTASPFNAGSYIATATFAGNSDYEPGSASAEIIIEKADPVVEWSNPDDIVYGTALSEEQLNATANVAGVFAYVPASGTMLGAGQSQSLSAVFTPSDPMNYNSVTATVYINVLKYVPTITVMGGTFEYDGLAHPATVMVTGVDGEVLLPVTITYNGSVEAPVSVGVYAVVAAFGGDGNYESVTGVGSIVINPVAPETSTLSGHVYRDVSGNGLNLTGNDPDVPLAGVTVKLYRDLDADGYLDSNEAATVVASAVSGSDGAYSFSVASNGAYIVKEVVPSGYVRTVPLFADYYAVTVSGVTEVENLDFDNFLKCTFNITNVTFTIERGCSTFTDTDLRGKTKQGDTVTVNFTVPVAPAYVSLVVYDAPSAIFEAAIASEQTIFMQQDLYVSVPGTYHLTVTLPNNYYQIDFVKCRVIDQLGPAGSNIFYSPQGRLISADNGGLHSDVEDEAAASRFWANLGQSLILELPSTASGLTLGQWLAQSFPRLYGAGCVNLSTKSNSYIASYFKSLYTNSSKKANAEVMATALNVYASTRSLGGEAATTYGFNVTDGGLGVATFNIQSYGVAFGVSNNSTLSVMQMLQKVNSKSSNGVLYNNQSNISSLLSAAYSMFKQVNDAGGIV